MLCADSLDSIPVTAPPGMPHSEGELNLHKLWVATNRLSCDLIKSSLTRLNFFCKPAGVQNPDIIGAQAQSPANAQPWDYDGIANSNLPRASGTPAASAAIVRVTAEQEAPHSEILRHSTGIGCLLLSINPTLLKEMSGKMAPEDSKMTRRACSCRSKE